MASPMMRLVSFTCSFGVGHPTSGKAMTRFFDGVEGLRLHFDAETGSYWAVDGDGLATSVPSSNISFASWEPVAQKAAKPSPKNGKKSTIKAGTGEAGAVSAPAEAPEAPKR